MLYPDPDQMNADPQPWLTLPYSLNTGKKDDLKGGGLEGVLVLKAVGDQLALAHVVEPVQLPTRVLTTVEGSEPDQSKV
jgi:hypothetical protein